MIALKAAWKNSISNNIALNRNPTPITRHEIVRSLRNNDYSYVKADKGNKF